mmetsp:Transcript_58390/g.52602  ORF Transcript_58390/g.52602 Transcript_58390/m.52602 type:complete len:110 (+) Transcript_58390:110-439(+)
MAILNPCLCITSWIGLNNWRSPVINPNSVKLTATFKKASKAIISTASTIDGNCNEHKLTHFLRHSNNGEHLHRNGEVPSISIFLILGKLPHFDRNAINDDVSPVYNDND